MSDGETGAALFILAAIGGIVYGIGALGGLFTEYFDVALPLLLTLNSVALFLTAWHTLKAGNVGDVDV